MKTALKIFGFILLGMVLLYFLTIPLRNVLVKKGVVDYLSLASGRPVEIDRLRIGIAISPIRIEGLRIGASREGGEAEMELREVLIDFRLRSLFQEHLHLNELVVDLGSLTVEKQADGSTNFDWVDGLVESHELGLPSLSGEQHPATQPPVEIPPAKVPPIPAPRLRPLPVALSTNVVAPAAAPAVVQREEAVKPVPPPVTVKSMAERSLSIDRFELRIGTVKVRDYSYNPTVPMSVDMELGFKKVYRDIADPDALYQQMTEDLMYRSLGGSLDDLKLPKKND